MTENLELARPIRRHRRGQRLFWIFAALALLAVGSGWVAARYFPASDPPSYRTAVVEQGDLEATVTALGSVKPKIYVDVGTQVSGQLRRVHVKVGDRVERGALLAEIDPTVYETRVSTGRANLNSLRAQLLQQEAELALARQRAERYRRLVRTEAVSQETVEELDLQVQIAEARAASIRAQIEAAESSLAGDVANLGYTRIYAPITGTVVDESAVEGQTVNASQAAPVILRIADLDTMTIWAKVAEADVVRLEPGLPVRFNTLGRPEQRWHSTVRQILPTPDVVNDVVLYNVLVDIANPGHRLMTDMTVQVFFVLGEERGVPLVPVAALEAGSASGVYRAQVLTAGGPEPRTVRVGLMNRSAAQVLDGLDVGERVILRPERAAADARRPPPRPRL
jgi:membrane fusion protein, macrolide-specific efflux system